MRLLTQQEAVQVSGSGIPVNFEQTAYNMIYDYCVGCSAEQVAIQVNEWPRNWAVILDIDVFDDDGWYAETFSYFLQTGTL